MSAVQIFFNSIAPNYKKKWENPFLAYYFNLRNQLATQNLVLQGKSILDIGAGTGGLYDHLTKQKDHFYYTGLDFSKSMLSYSTIPKPNRLVANALHQQADLEASFDLIFALGLTSYIPPKKLPRLMQNIKFMLKPEGQAILSFTNLQCPEVKLRSKLRFFYRLFPSKTLLGAPFSITSSTPDAIQKILPDDLIISSVQYYAPCIPLLSSIVPSVASNMSIFLTDVMKKAHFFRFLTGDFILTIKKCPSPTSYK